jgi:ribonuclease-3
LFSALFSRAASPEDRRIQAWCRKTLGLSPKDLALYRQALRHSSAVPEGRPDLPDNERLEFLGDAVLDTVVGQFLFRTYPDKGEGFLTRMRSKLVSRHQLSILAKHVGIDRVMEFNIGRGQDTSVPGNAMEALIGALFLDKGFDRTNATVIKLITAHFDLKTIELEDRDSKSRLLEWGQKKRRKVEFMLSEEASMGGRGRGFVAEVMVDGQLRGTGRGHSKKKAEQDAARAAYRSVRPQGPKEGQRQADGPALPRTARHRVGRHRSRKGGQPPAGKDRPREEDGGH